ncbi:MAG: hypothetical protein R3C39_01310 [Dehalococcoidia bacterium]
MSLPDCFAIMAQAGNVLERPDGAAEARRLIEAGASTDEVIEAFVRLADPSQITGLREEMQELPETTVSSILGAWMLASAANKPLHLKSAAPDRPLEAARARRVEIRIVMEEDGVSVTLSHIPGRHASWYRPASAVA